MWNNQRWNHKVERLLNFIPINVCRQSFVLIGSTLFLESGTKRAESESDVRKFEHMEKVLRTAKNISFNAITHSWNQHLQRPSFLNLLCLE